MRHGAYKKIKRNSFKKMLRAAKKDGLRDKDAVKLTRSLMNEMNRIERHLRSDIFNLLETKGLILDNEEGHQAIANVVTDSLDRYEFPINDTDQFEKGVYNINTQVFYYQSKAPIHVVSISGSVGPDDTELSIGGRKVMPFTED